MMGWIGVDLDGTLAHYEGWKDGKIGRPIPRMANRVKAWLDEGRDVRIFTARAWPLRKVDSTEDLSFTQGSTEREKEAIHEVINIQKWCVEHFGRKLPVTCQKDYAMVELWDDRAVQVIPNTGERADGN
jgi:hypothetical protein